MVAVDKKKGAKWEGCGKEARGEEFSKNPKGKNVKIGHISQIKGEATP